MTTEGRIPVLVGGPAHGFACPAIGPLAGPIIESHYGDPHGPVHTYRRRTFAVGATSAHAWVFGDPEGGATDAQAAELVWRWALEHAGAIPPEEPRPAWLPR